MSDFLAVTIYLTPKTLCTGFLFEWNNEVITTSISFLYMCQLKKSKSIVCSHLTTQMLFASS